MTIRDHAFWLYLLCLVLIGTTIIWSILTMNYHPSIEVRNTFIVLDTDATSISVQWYRGDIAVWINTNGKDWRLFPPR